MGAFALCIENATRDIHSLLKLHRVHPQVHADIQRILSSLLRKQYTEMTVLHSPRLSDSPEQVCRVLVDQIIDQTVKSAIPLADVAALEKRCMQLEEEKDALEAEAVEAESQLVEVQALLHNLKDAHDYMLHRYFREVLILRSRIDDLQKQNRVYRTHAVAATPVTNIGACTVFSTSMGSQLQHFVLNNIGNTNISSSRYNTAMKRGGTEEVLSSEAAALESDFSAPSTSSVPPSCEGRIDKAEGASTASSSIRSLADTRRGFTSERPSDVRAQTTLISSSAPATGGNSTTKALSPSTREKDRSVRIVPTTFSGAPRGQVMTMQATSTSTCEVMPQPEPESVNAIFDYEEYIRILNGERGSWDERFAEAMKEPDGSARRQRRSSRVRTRSSLDVILRGSDAMRQGGFPSSLEEQQEQELTLKKGFQWLLHFALEPIKHKFHVELNHLRQAVHTMQKEHERDIQAISHALMHVQSRTDGLLDFLETFVQETQCTIAVLFRDARAHNITDLLSSGILPMERSVNIASFFSPSGPSALGVASSTASSPLPPPPLTQISEIIDSDAAKEESTVPSTSSYALHPRKEWRLKPDVRLNTDKGSAAMMAMDIRLKRPGASKAVAVTTVPPSADDAASYYRADLGLPYWSAHPVTTHAQEVFNDMQVMANEMRKARLQQLYNYEELARANGKGRRVQFGSPDENDIGAGRRRRRKASLTPSQVKPDCFYATDAADSFKWPRRQLLDGWRTKTVIEGDGATAAELLLELVHLRMRRACDQIRLKRAQDTIMRTFYPNLAQCEEVFTAPTKDGKRVATGAKLKPSKLPAINFTSPEEALRHGAMERHRTNVQKRLDETSQCIARLQRLLDIFLSENEVHEVANAAVQEAARCCETEEAAGIYRVNGKIKSVAQLWSSPYLNDDKGPNGVVFMPIGLASTLDAEGNVSGGAGACVVLGDTPISIAPYAATASPLLQESSFSRREWKGKSGSEGEGEEDGSGSGDRDEGRAPNGVSAPRNTPYVAVMDYCRGVQLGRPVGHRGGPVYVFQDPNTGAYYVGDGTGRPAIQGDDEKGSGDASTEKTEGGIQVEADGRRPPLAMTRILFPAPLRYSCPTTTAAVLSETDQQRQQEDNGERIGLSPSSSALPDSRTTALSTRKALQPLYLVPMAIPLSDDEAVIREGWQASHRHGHTRQDPIFYTTLAPLPLSSSYHHVVPQQQDNVGGAAAAAATQKAEGRVEQMQGGINKYLVDPPRVFQPMDEAAAAVRVRALRLQNRNAPDSTLPRTAAAATMPEGSEVYPTVPPSAKSISYPATEGNTDKSPASSSATRIGLSSGSSANLNPLATASSADAAYTAAMAGATTATAAAASLSAQLSPQTLDTLHVSSTGTAATTGLESYPPGSSSLPNNSDNTAFASTVPAPTASTSLTAAVLLAKQQRAARLAREAEAASQLNAQRQEAWLQQQCADTRAPAPKTTFLRLPHLAPLRANGTDSMAVLPPAASSARLQRQMRPEKYSLAPLPPPSARRVENSKHSSPEWNLRDDI